jgi:hypothetical protein
MLGSGYPKSVIRIRLRFFEFPISAFLPMGAVMLHSRVECGSEVWREMHLSGHSAVNEFEDLHLSDDGLRAHVKTLAKCTLVAFGYGAIATLH